MAGAPQSSESRRHTSSWWFSWFWNFFSSNKQNHPPSDDHDVESGLLNRSSVHQEELEAFKAAASNNTRNLDNVTIRDSSNISSFVKLEWCGSLCSGKYSSVYINSANKAVDNRKTSMQFYLSPCKLVLHNERQGVQASTEFPGCFWEDTNLKSEDFRTILNCCKSEIESLNCMRHENIIALFGVYYGNNLCPMLVMESVEFDLDHCLEHKHLASMEVLCFVLKGIASGIIYLHDVALLVHNNISPKSILLTKTLVAKISSFECAADREYGNDENDICCSISNDIFAFGKVISKCVTSSMEYSSGKDQLLGKSLYSIGMKCVGRIKPKSLRDVLEMLEYTEYHEDDLPVDSSFTLQKEDSTGDNAHKMKGEAPTTDDVLIDDEHDSSSNDQFADAVSDLSDDVSNTKDGIPLPLEKFSNPKNVVDAETQTHVEVDEYKASSSNKDEDSQTQVLKEENEKLSKQLEDYVTKELVLKEEMDSLQKTMEKELVLKEEMDNLQKTIEKLKEENEKLNKQLEDYVKQSLQIEQEHFKLTNSFTTVDSRSPLALSQEYRHIQHNIRPAAGRAHKRNYDCQPVPFEEHTMLAYEEARKLVSTTFEQYLTSMFNLQEESDAIIDAQIPKSFRLTLDKFYDKHPQLDNPIKSIQKVLHKAYEIHVKQKGAVIPDQVQQYYEKLASFTWTAVTKAIPMVLSTKCDKFDDSIHELKDGSDDVVVSTSATITYVYPTLLTSNSWPREVAMKGRVKII